MEKDRLRGPRFEFKSYRLIHKLIVILTLRPIAVQSRPTSAPLMALNTVDMAL